MELRVLEYFLILTEERNISRAAKRLHITQPSLSRQLKNLESELGVTLFVRGSREITLTQSGEYLAEQARQLTSLANKTQANIMQTETIAGSIYIGSAEIKAFDRISAVYEQFHSSHPLVQLRLFDGNADEILQQIDNGILDFGIITGPAQKERYEQITLTSQEIWGILVASQHPLAAQKQVTASELAEHPLIVSDQSLVSNQLSDWFGQNVNQLNIVATYNLLSNVAYLVKRNLGIAISFDDIINTTGTNLTFVPLTPSLTASINVVWRSETTMSPAAHAFLQTLLEFKQNNKL